MTRVHRVKIPLVSKIMKNNKKTSIMRKILSFTLTAIIIFTMIPISKASGADVGIGTDGSIVDLSLWNYTADYNSYSLNKYKGSFVDGKITGSVPAIINGIPVAAMSSTFESFTDLMQAPDIPDSVIHMNSTFSGCTSLMQVPEIPNIVRDMEATFSDCTNLTGNIFIPKTVIRISDIFTNTSMPITMIYSSDNAAAASSTVPANVTKVIDSVSPVITSVTGVNTSKITINATDDYKVYKYAVTTSAAIAVSSVITTSAITTSDTVPTTSWQSSNVFSNLPYGIYYAWAMDGVGNISESKSFTISEAVGTDGSSVDLNLWDYTIKGDTYCLNGYKGSIVDGKIVGSVPAIIYGIPVTEMNDTFKGLTGLTQPPEIPSSVISMDSTFFDCKGLIQAPQIPNSVTNMRYTFNGCTGLTQAPRIPNGVISMNHTFSNCTRLTEPPEIPNSVTDMNATFSKCINLIQLPEIPDSVVDLSYAFYMCSGLSKASIIPNSVTNLQYTFYGCNNLTGDVLIPKSVTKISNIFTNTSMPITMVYSSNNKLAKAYSAPANVTKVIDSVSPIISSVSVADNSIVAINASDDYLVEKYAITTSNTVPTTDWQASNKFSNLSIGRYYAWAMDYAGNISVSKSFMFPTVVAIGTDGSDVDLSLWDYTDNGNTNSLVKYVGSFVDGKIIGTVPAKINGKPVTVMSNTFKGCKGLIKAPQIPTSVTDMSYTFDGCTGLNQAPKLPNGVIDMRYTFNGCKALTQAPELPNSVTTINHTFSGCTALIQAPKIPNNITDMNAAFSKCSKLSKAPEIPASVVDMSYAFYMCTGLTQIPVIPDSITDMKYTFYGCTNLTGNLFIKKSVIRMSNIFTGTLMPITMVYSNDNTAAKAYSEPANVTKVIDSLAPEITNVNQTYSSIILIASDDYLVEKYAITTSNTAPTTGWQSSNVFLDIPDGRYYAWAIDRVGNISKSNVFVFPQTTAAVGTDGSSVDLKLWKYTNNGDTYSLDGYEGSIVNGKIVGSVPATINRKPVTAMSNTFNGCSNLVQAPKIPDSVIKMDSTFSGCTGLTQAPLIPDSVTNMAYSFLGCTSLKQAPITPDSVTNMEAAFSGCTSLTGNVYITKKVINVSNIFINTSMPITMVYSSANTIAQAYSAPSNVKKEIDSVAPVIPNVQISGTKSQNNMTLKLLGSDNYYIKKYAVSTSSTVPTTGWQSSNVFPISSDGLFYLWAIDGVGNLSGTSVEFYWNF